MITTLRLIAASSLCTAVGLAHAPQASPSSASDATALVARVNGDPITRAELRRVLGNPLTRQHLQDRGVKEPDSQELEEFALRRLIHRRLMLQEASRRKLAITSAEVDSGLAALRRRFDDLKSFGQWLRDQELDDRALMASIREELLATRVAGALVAGVQFTDSEVREYYHARKGDLKVEEVWIQVIAVPDKAAAEEIQQALKSGEDFGRLAQRRSVGVRAAEGGNVGWVESATLWAPMREAVSTLKPGEAIGPLQKGEHILIVRLHKRRQGRTKTLGEARGEIERHLLAQKQQAALQAWAVAQERTAMIEVFER